METSKEKFCPVISTDGYYKCKGPECAWWCGFAQDCAIPLMAGMFADSKVCDVRFEISGVNARSFRGEGEVIK